MNTPKMTKGHQQVMAYFLVNDADAFMTFLKSALGAKDREVHRDNEGGVMHAELTLGESVLMLGQSTDQWAARPSMCYVYVNDIDTTHSQCLSQGSTELYAPREEPYGVRGSGVRDAWGNTWWFAQMH
jgi:PhnB protein